MQEDAPAPGAYQASQTVYIANAIQDVVADTTKFSTGPKHVFGSGQRSNLSGQDGPGPGQYAKKDFVGSGPKFSCTPRRDRPAHDVSEKPGPGAHNVPTSLGKDAPTAKFGTSQRRGGSMPASPGPVMQLPHEATHKQTHHKSPEWGFGTSERRAGGTKTQPGPDTYIIPSRLVEGPKYSAAPRREEGGRSDGPGPSAYSLGSSVGTGLQWSMRQRTREAGTNDDPGPGAYQAINMEQVKEQTPGWRFGTSNREPTGSFNPPGPGTYEPSDPRNPQPKYKFGTSNRPGQVKSSNPGPGSYEVASEIGAKKDVHHTPKYTGTPRGKVQPSKTPGPGSYEQSVAATTQNAPKFGFGTAKRTGELGAGAGTPGPGTYSHATTMSGAKFSLQSRRQFESHPKGRGGAANITPGPGAHGGSFTQFGY